MSFGRDTKLRTAVTWTGAVAVVASLSLLGTPCAGAAAEVVTLPGPASVLTLGIFPGSNDDDLKGVVCQSPNTCEAVRYPSWLSYAAGAGPLNTDLHELPGRKIVYGYSQGGQVITAWMDKYAATADAPPADELVFVIIANGDRAHGGANTKAGHVMPETQYHVIDIARQYDFGADMPDDRFNLLAMANALAGFRFIHMDYEEVDIYDPANIVWTEGNTTYVLVPTENLPLLEPLRRLGLDTLADKLNGPLKEIVERGYNRDYLPQQQSPLESSTPIEPTEPVTQARTEPTVPAEPAESADSSKPAHSIASTEPTGLAEPIEPTAAVTTASPDDDQVEPVRARTHRWTIRTPALSRGGPTLRARIDRSRGGLAGLGVRRPTSLPASAGVDSPTTASPQSTASADSSTGTD